MGAKQHAESRGSQTIGLKAFGDVSAMLLSGGTADPTDGLGAEARALALGRATASSKCQELRRRLDDRSASDSALLPFKLAGGEEYKTATTRLVEAAGRGQIEAVHRLLDNGAHPSRRPRRGGGTPMAAGTALQAAASAGQEEMCQLLVEKGANLDVRDGSSVHGFSLFS